MFRMQGSDALAHGRGTIDSWGLSYAWPEVGKYTDVLKTYRRSLADEKLKS